MPVLDTDLDLSRVPAGDAPFGLRLLDPPDVVETAIRVVERALSSYRGTPAADGAWLHLLRQVDEPRSTRRKGATPELYEPDVVAALLALTPVRTTPADRKQQAKEDHDLTLWRRRQVVDHVFAELLSGVQQTTPGGGPADALQEWETLSGTTQRYVLDGRAGYQVIRADLLAHFGALADGSAKAIERINAYYGTTIKKRTVLGYPDVPVHPDLGAAIDRALRTLAPARRAALAAAGIVVNGAKIRPNANNKMRLSEHSFGFAVDIDANTNPNITGFPVEFIEQITGITLLTKARGGTDVQVFDARGVADWFTQKAPAEREIDRLIAADAALVEAFSSEERLGAGMAAVVVRQTGSQPDPARLLAAAQDAEEERRSLGQPLRWRFADPTVWRRRAAKDGPAQDTLAALVFPLPTHGAPLPEDPRLAVVRRPVVELLVQMAGVYRRSFLPQPKLAKAGPVPAPLRVKPSANPGADALQQIAGSGFLNLPRDLVLALRDPAGGDLKWLGSADHMGDTRDFMHFELKKPPSLYSR
ncbi:hypothetical protein [Actinomycetospora chibensis]|uniref:Uncharacterized protein n=1 Tax=Actinomycetospora chibensis TaxID=663606 RepID=A0ABV9RN14_9PSEU|nr:hypothetical protein [Actinomycetospora chibensis]MDD7926953.1 hypothetical protein [Actinomycetospora chibensis]